MTTSPARDAGGRPAVRQPGSPRSWWRAGTTRSASAGAAKERVGGRRGASNCPTTSPAPSAPTAGYLPTERREIEAELFSGRLRGVVATTALELGIDVGGLDACVLAGFPRNASAMWQQAGRAGGDGQQCLAVLVAEDQLDQWMVAHPTELFTGPRAGGGEPGQPLCPPPSGGGCFRASDHT